MCWSFCINNKAVYKDQARKKLHGYNFGIKDVGSYQLIHDCAEKSGPYS